MKRAVIVLLFGALAVGLTGWAGWVAAQDKKAADGSAGREGSWQLVKVKVGDGEWQEPAKGEVQLLHVTRTHFAWLVVDAESKQVVRGAGGKYTIKGDTFKSTVEYYRGRDEKDGVGKTTEYTWERKGAELHESWTGGKQVWRAAK